MLASEKTLTLISSGWTVHLFKLAEGWLFGGIMVPALALDGADLGLREVLANFWQNGFLMTIPL